MAQDDPEKRISELERQLAEKYTVAEPERLQAEAQMPWATHGPPVPGPPTPYGPDASRASAALYGWGPAGAGFTRWQRRRPLRSLRLVWFLAAFWLVMVPVGIAVAHFSPISDSHTLPSLTVNKGGVVEFTGDNQTGTTACHDGTVKLSGHDDTVTITGHCGSVDVSGTDIHVTIDSADTIDAGGVGNVIVYHSGTPDIKRSGANVSVSQG